MLGTVIQLIIIVCFPLAALYLAARNKILKWISPVVLCYAMGLSLANIKLFPVDADLAVAVSEATIPLAIGLILFSANFARWIKTTKKAAFSFFLCIVASVISAAGAAYIFSTQLVDSWKLAGMAVGVYTGGTPNMSAIGLSLGVNEETFILLNASDVVLGGAYLVFLFTFAHHVARKLLPRYRYENNLKAEPEKEPDDAPLKSKVGAWLQALLLAILILALAIGLSYTISGGISVAIVMLTVTTLGIAASFSGRIRSLKGAFELGEYLLLIFCCAIGSLADFSELIHQSSAIFYFCLTVMAGSILIHFLLAFLFRVDADTMVITSVAGIYGPAFVPPMASVMKNREVVVTGLTTGIIGYAVANYLGILLAYMLQP